MNKKIAILFGAMLFCQLIIATSIFAQAKFDVDENETTDSTLISYGESLSGYNFNDAVNWSIYNTDHVLIAKGKGAGFENYVFKKPGFFTVEVKEIITHLPHTCNHLHFPEKIKVTVSPYKMQFNFYSVKIDAEIIGGKEVSGNTITVDVYFKSYNNKTTVYNNGRINTSGVNTSIQGLLTCKPKLHNGKNTLRFSLNGSATSSTYIQFDFKDINNKTQSYGYPKIIP